MNAYTRYEINKKDGKYIATIKQYGKSDEEAQKVEVSENKVKELESILNKYNVIKWNGFNQNDKNVLDGDSFSLSIHMEDDKDISASGYMKWPDNYKNVREELNSFFEDLLK